jgi:hypothetical protein
LTVSDSRIAGIAAIIFAVLFVAAMIAPGEPPEDDAPDDELVEYYEDSGNQQALLAAVYMMTVAAASLIVLATIGFRSGTTLAAIARAMAYLAATAFAFGSVAFATVGVENMMSDAPIDPGVARFLPSLGYGTILVVGGLAAALMVGAASLDWQRSRAMPNWLCWLGFVFAVVLLFSILFIPMIALILWALIVGIVLLSRGSSQPASVAA